MTSREGVRQTLQHREPDRVPFDLGGSVVTSITIGAYKPLRQRLGLPDIPIRVLDRMQGLPELSEDFLQRLRVDTRPLTPNPLGEAEIVVEGDYYVFTDEQGARLRSPREGGLYYDLFEFPIKEPTREALA